MLLEIEDFILALSMEVLEGFILALLLDGYVQVVKSWKVLSLLLELEGFILALLWTCWKVFVLARLLKVTSEKRKDDKA